MKYIAVTKVSKKLYGEENKIRSNSMSKYHQEIIDECNKIVDNYLEKLKAK